MRRRRYRAESNLDAAVDGLQRHHVALVDLVLLLVIGRLDDGPGEIGEDQKRNVYNGQKQQSRLGSHRLDSRGGDLAGLFRHRSVHETPTLGSSTPGTTMPIRLSSAISTMITAMTVAMTLMTLAITGSSGSAAAMYLAAHRTTPAMISQTMRVMSAAIMAETPVAVVG